MSSELFWAVAMICGTVVACAIVIGCVLVAQGDQHKREAAIQATRDIAQAELSGRVCVPKGCGAHGCLYHAKGVQK
jgi:hypothetical protein